MRVISNVVHYTIYGVDVIYDKTEGIYRAFIGGKKYEETSLSTLQYVIQNLQNGVGVIH